MHDRTYAPERNATADNANPRELRLRAKKHKCASESYERNEKRENGPTAE